MLAAISRKRPLDDEVASPVLGVGCPKFSPVGVGKRQRTGMCTLRGDHTRLESHSYFGQENAENSPNGTFNCPENPKAFPTYMSILKKRRRPSDGKFLLAEDELKYIVDKAVEERENQLREEYGKVLSEKLQEQFNMFIQYSNECLNADSKCSESLMDSYIG